MLSIEYSIEANTNYLYEIAESLGKDTGKHFVVKNNGLVFPPDVASGRFEYHILDSGLCMVILDCEFYEEVKFYRPPMSSNYFYAVTFNLSAFNLAVQIHDIAETRSGNCWENKIFFGSSRKGFGWSAPPNNRVRMLAIYMDRGWIQKKYRIADARNSIPYIKELKMGVPLQVWLDLDLEVLTRVQEVLMTPPPVNMAKLYYKGDAKMLLSLVLQRILAPPEKESKLQYADVAKIMSVEKELENALDKPLPSLDETARKCLMSQTKFVTLFRAVYGKTYGQYFNEVKMKKAQEFLLQEKEVREVAPMLGFVNVSHFIKLFKEYYNETPKQYIKLIKEDCHV